MRRQILALTELMKKDNIGVYAVSDLDEHLSEYTVEHFHALEEFSGFTGGDGKLVVTAAGKAYLFTDGRYFIQAEKELSGSSIELMRVGEPGVPDMYSFIAEKLSAGGMLGFDGKCFSYASGLKLKKAAGKNGYLSIDLCGEVWPDRPAVRYGECFVHDIRYCGRSAEDKIALLRNTIRKMNGADTYVSASLDDNAWLLNLRGGDVPYNPVFFSYLIVESDEVRLYADSRHFKGERGRKAAAYLKEKGVTPLDYEAFYADLQKLKGRVLIDPARCNFELSDILNNNENAEVVNSMSPIAADKCRKNDIEAECLRTAQLRDSAALTKFIYWFKKSMGLENVTEPGGDLMKAHDGGLSEITVSDKLHEFRTMQKGFIEESFDTISAYGENAAMAHYMPSRDNDVHIEPRGLYLVDSGGQYPEGTTDVTRTFSCGPISDEEKESFTLVVMANLRLADAVFPEGTSGLTLDYPARELFWRKGLNYNHGTGHGVGYFLNVHEAPVGIRYRAATIEGAYPMYEGMYVSDEPGMYEEGRYGIRIENLLLARHDFDSRYGRFLNFEVMNFCPIDKTCLDLSLMEKRDIGLLNAYHEKVYNKLIGEMNEEEAEWLKKACAAID